MNKPPARFWHAYDRANGGDGQLVKDLNVGPARAKRKHTPRERDEVQNPVLQMLRVHPQVAWCARINSGAYKTPDGRFIRFGFVGCSDIIGQMRDGGFLALECKTEEGEATAEQIAFIDRVRANKGCAGIVRSVEEAIAVIRGYLA